VRRLLDPIVKKLEGQGSRSRRRDLDGGVLGIRRIELENQPFPFGCAKRIRQYRLGRAHYQSEPGQIKAAAHARSRFERFPGQRRQPDEFAAHQLEDILGDALCRYAAQVPYPSAGAVIELDQPVAV